MSLLDSTEEKWLYPFQWLWDTFFICAWNHNTDQSIFDAGMFLNAQQPNGFCGHIRYNREILERRDYFPPPDVYFMGKLPEKGEISSKITQPPNIGYGLLEMAKKILKKNGDLNAVKLLFQRTLKYHEYIYANRIIDGCMVTIHPWEAGDDNSPKWDVIYKKLEKYISSHGDLGKIINDWLNNLDISFERADIKIVKHTQRPTDPHYYLYLFLIYLYGRWNWDDHKILKDSPFRVLDPMTNAILLRSDVSLLELADVLGEKSNLVLDKINEWINISKIGLEQLWSEDHKLYLAKDLYDGSLINIETVSGFIPLFSNAIPASHAAKIAEKLNKLILTGDTKFQIPSTLFKEHKYFDPERYWRGPVWIITNELVAQGLDFYGYKKLSDFIRANILMLVSNSLNDRGGFYEYFNSITGAGLGSARQSWTAAAVLNALSVMS